MMPTEATEPGERDVRERQRDWHRDQPAPGPVGVEIPFESRRVPMRRRVILKFQHVSGFVGEYAANISLKGMFIRAWVPEPPGTVFLFEIWVSDSRRLIHGVAEVVWVRDADETPERPAGMGVRFLKLDDESRATVERIVEAHLKGGGEPFRLERPEGCRGSVPEPLQPAPRPEDGEASEAAEGGSTVAPPEPVWMVPNTTRVMVRRRRPGLLASALAAGLLLAAALLAGYFFL